MKRIDGRMRSPKDQLEVRANYVQLRNDGMGNQEAAKKAGINETRASTIWQLHINGGDIATELKPRGRKKGVPCKLTVEQEKEVKKYLIWNTPDQLGLDFHLWSREAIRQVIMEKFDLEIPLRTVTDYLKRWGVSSPEPVKEVLEKGQPAYEWFKKSYPELLARARRGEIEIHWCFESTIVTQADRIKKSRPKTKSKGTDKRDTKMFSSKTNQGQVRFMLYRGDLTQRIFTEFIQRLVKNCKRNMFLVFDENELFEYNFNKPKSKYGPDIYSRRKHGFRIEVVYLERNIL